MFEIRIICETPDRESVVNGLRSQFNIGRVRSSFSLTSGGERLYLTADLPAANPWPTPEQAYAGAPGVGYELEVSREILTDTPLSPDLNREYWLRRAAALDRMALGLAPGHDATPEAARDAAISLMDLDSTAGLGPSGYADGPYHPDHPESTRDPRGYVRQEFAIWHKNNQ
ncbi:hypothetical protein PV689_01650 [Streptomyces sp. ATCC51928]|uniref:Uncharacterized protein n=1 Tax=Streptomyces caviscabies TaxID=90079 RepID=A0ABW2ME50_9ACTN|nr:MULTISPECIES: hypothetical protein [unclassified Streptomyces]MDX3500616.1 hypothetical protein [Streptomyces sp. ATCC51928]MDX5520677.1 hypothetical protein [Streptomyces sp. DE06-01C]